LANLSNPLALIARFKGELIFLSYMPVLFTATALSFLRVIIYAHVLDVAQFGVASMILLVSGLFGIIGHLGTQVVAHRELPLMLSKSRRRRAVWLLSRVVLTISASAAVALVCAVAGLKVFSLGSAEMSIGIAHGWCHQVFMTLSIESKSRLMMREYATSQFTRALAATIAGVAAAYIVRSGAATVLAETCAFGALTPSMILRILKEAGLGAKVGLLLGLSTRREFPRRAALYLLGSSLVSFASINIDRWIAAALLDKSSFGIYAFAVIALSVAQLAQYIINAGAFPLLAHKRNEFGNAHVFKLTALWSFAAFVGGLIVVVPTAALVRPLVQVFFPAYTAGVASIVILMPAALLRVSDFWSSYLIIAERESLLLVSQLVALGATFAFWVVWFGGSDVASVTAFAWLALTCAATSHIASASASVWISRQ
jgi:O-antigen/teichoic acid export membrane protein